MRKFRVLVLITALFAMSCVVSVRAEPQDEPYEPTVLGSGKRLYSELQQDVPNQWNGFYSQLKNAGITMHLQYEGELFQSFNLIPDGITAYRGLLDIMLAVDTGKVGLWPHGELFIEAQNGHGRSLETYAAGLKPPISDIDAQDFTQISEYGLRQSLFNDLLELKIGKQDVNDLFSVNDVGAELIYPPYTLIPTVPMPTFPFPGAGMSVTARPDEDLHMRAGFYDGGEKIETFGVGTLLSGEGGYFALFEPTWHSHFGANKDHDGKYRVGAWYHTGDFEETGDNPNSKTLSGNYGFYLLMEQKVYKENSDIEDNQGLDLFFQYGWAPSDRNQVTQYVGGGLGYTGMFAGRDHDKLVLAASYTDIVGDAPSEGRTGLTNIELFYLLQLTSWLGLQPDIQYYHDPSSQSSNGLAAGVRCRISF